MIIKHRLGRKCEKNRKEKEEGKRKKSKKEKGR